MKNISRFKLEEHLRNEGNDFRFKGNEEWILEINYISYEVLKLMIESPNIYSIKLIENEDYSYDDNMGDEIRTSEVNLIITWKI